jgi:hypothetical protein
MAAANRTTPKVPNQPGIFQIRCLVDGKVYVGRAWNLRVIRRRSLNRLRLGIHWNRYLQEAWLQHGADQFAFEVVELVGDPVALKAAHQKHVDQLQAHQRDKGYNESERAGSRLGFRSEADRFSRLSSEAKENNRLLIDTRSLPAKDYLLECFRYEDGKLYWLPRPREHFSNDYAWRIHNSREAGNEAGAIGGYEGQKRCIISINKEKFMRYRIVWAIHHGDCPFRIDHKDRNSLNDRIENLRPASQSQNNANSAIRSNNTSGYKGVRWDKTLKRWRAYLHFNGNQCYLGSFESAEEAHEVYMKAARDHFGEFATDGRD